MRGPHEVNEVLPQRLFVSFPGSIWNKDAHLIQLKPLGVIQFTFRDRTVIVKPMFNVADTFRRLIVKSPDTAEIFWHTALGIQWNRKRHQNKRCYKVVSSHGISPIERKR